MATSTTLRTHSGYVLPDLPYAPDALAPVLSPQLMELHHDKHHAAYVKAANTLLEELADLPADADPSDLTAALSFNVGGHVLHSVFWTSMTPDQAPASPQLAAAITESFGSQAALEKRMAMTVAKLRGSGWAMLSWEPLSQRLIVQQVHDHQSGLVACSTPILLIDGWEHAYYLDYKADRASWGERFFEVADWVSASERFVRAVESNETYL
jgi:Fe-Mn family superoxide dismutase